MKRALVWSVNIILIWLLLVVVALFVLPRISSWRFDTVLSGSMEPAMSTGGVAVIMPVNSSDISAGEVIAYRLEGVVITHRVIEVTNNQGTHSFITKGDANENPDPSPVPAENVVGRVVFDMPYLGYLAAFIRTGPGFMLAIFLPGLAIIGLELQNMWRACRPKLT